MHFFGSGCERGVCGLRGLPYHHRLGGIPIFPGELFHLGYGFPFLCKVIMRYSERAAEKAELAGGIYHRFQALPALGTGTNRTQ